MSTTPQDPITTALKLILEQRQTLTRPHAAALLAAILNTPPDPARDLKTAALLGALAARHETPEELAGFVDTLRARSLPLPLTLAEQALCIDTCGTGGDLSGTFNISTAAGLVSAAAGVMVAKHGNRAVTSRAGSADVLEALGIPITLTPTEAADALRRHRFAFLPAPDYNPALKLVMPIRRALGVRTAFNILGPMLNPLNPASAGGQVMGVYAPHLVPIAAQALAALGTRHAFIVHGASSQATNSSGLDEISIAGPTTVAEIRNTTITYATLTPADFGLPFAPIDTLAGGDAQTNAHILRSIFAGEPGPRRNVVVLNAAAVLVTANLAPDLPTAARLAERTLDSGAVLTLIQNLSS